MKIDGSLMFDPLKVGEMAARLEAAGTGVDARVYWASPRLSLDNGAMVARAGRFRLERGDVAPLDVNASPNLPFPGLSRPSQVDIRIAD